MSGKNKNYNSIIFLTTLSVYLSISLLGATPQVLAYAATTRNFDIQTEIEYKDDLDNKPDSEEAENPVESDFPQIFAHLLKQFGEKPESRIINSQFPNLFQYSTASKLSDYHQNHSDGLDYLFGDADQKFQPKGFQLTEKARLSKTFTSKVQADGTEFSIKTPIRIANANRFDDFLNRKFSSNAISIEDKSLKQIYENTNFPTENKQILVVTRLPRAAIDSLIK